MKAVQLKIVIKNSKPPIWRRVMVPTGITFSQLSMILNEVMGWSGYHLFEFEFYHRELRIAENADEFEIGYGPFDYIEASTTYIREFMEEEEWFTYTYDFGDHWKHRVTIEKIITDYPFIYPMVLKYKGDCPIEDCGGIEGYYECLEIINDESHPEREERLAWMESQGYPNEYDIAYVNEQLEQEYFYIWDGGEKRCQRQIYEEHFSGKNGLHVTRMDSNKNLSVNKSGRHKLQEMADLIGKTMQANSYWSEHLRISTLTSIFEDFDKDTLLEIAEEKGVKGVSQCNKKRLIEKLVNFMLQPQVFRSYLLCLQDEELKEFERVAKYKGVCETDSLELLTNLYEAAYIGVSEDGKVSVSQEVWILYQTITNKEFHAKRQVYSYVLACLRTAGVLYGVVPADILLKVINQHSQICVTDEELKQIIDDLPPEYADYLLKDNKIYHKALYPNDRGLVRAQGNKTYYIPTVKEIYELSIYEYFPNNTETLKFKRFLVKELDAMEDEAEIVTKIIQRKICGDCQMEDIFDVLDDFGLIDDEDDSFTVLDKITKQINHLWNNTRMLLNRGFTPNEIARQRDKSNVINFQEVRKNKVYPNDPCPCGSGKKYKKCCGKV